MKYKLVGSFFFITPLWQKEAGSVELHQYMPQPLSLNPGSPKINITAFTVWLRPTFLFATAVARRLHG
jgi:hypothetical protein